VELVAGDGEGGPVLADLTSEVAELGATAGGLLMSAVAPAMVAVAA
jgi:hypothetical protein